MTAKNEALFRLGKLLGDKEGPMAEEIKKIADLVGGIEESATKDVVSIPFISTPQKDTNINDWTVRYAVPKENASVEASIAADNPETFGTRL